MRKMTVALYKFEDDVVKWQGEGNCCGWYSDECFLDCTLVAAYDYLEDQSEIRNFYNHNHIREKIFGKHIIKAYIFSHYNTKVIECDSEKEAIKKFFNENF